METKLAILAAYWYAHWWHESAKHASLVPAETYAKLARMNLAAARMMQGDEEYRVFALRQAERRQSLFDMENEYPVEDFQL